MGKSALARAEQSLAYKLLLPTFIILFMIAAYPLAQVFYTSFTNKKFASSEKTKFVGGENYKVLLSMTIKELPVKIDKDTGKPEIDKKTGEIEYERARKVLPRTELKSGKKFRYKELHQFNMFGKRYVIGAGDPDFLKSIYNTLVFSFWSVLLETILGLIVALVVNSNFKGKGAMRAVMLIPWAVITVVSARMWSWMFQATRIGFFNSVLSRIGIGDGSFAFLTNDAWQLPSIIAVDVWKTTPFMALLILAGLQIIPKSLYEAAEVDGCGKIRQFFYITLPLLKPSLAVALVFRTLDALRAFDVFQVMLSTRKFSMASYNYAQLINYRDAGMASSIGVIIFIIIFGFAIGYIRMLGVDSDD